MGLMKIRKMATAYMVNRWPGSPFRGPATVAKVVTYSALAILTGGLSLWSTIVKGQDAGLGLLCAAVLALVAHAHMIRLKQVREQELLPECILCPSCEASIALGADERQEGRFACPSCGEDFEIVDEREEFNPPDAGEP